MNLFISLFGLGLLDFFDAFHVIDLENNFNFLLNLDYIIYIFIIDLINLLICFLI